MTRADQNTVISVKHRFIDGYHVFTSEDTGLYVFNKDAKKAFESVAPSLRKLIELNTGRDCTIEPAMNIDEFLRESRGGAQSGAPHPSVISSRAFVMRPAA